MLLTLQLTHQETFLQVFQDDPLSSEMPTSNFVDEGHLDRENDILGRQVIH